MLFTVKRTANVLTLPLKNVNIYFYFFKNNFNTGYARRKNVTKKRANTARVYPENPADKTAKNILTTKYTSPTVIARTRNASSNKKKYNRKQHRFFCFSSPRFTRRKNTKF